MEQVRKLELSLLKQYEKLPHLPDGFRKWLAENSWWLVLIGVVLSVFGLISIASVLMLLSYGLSLSGAALLGASGAVAGAVFGGIVLIVMILSLALFLVQTVLLGMAVTSLRDLQKRGWDLLFVVALINAAFTIISGVLSLQFGALVFGLFWAAVGAYFLFEVRDYFVAKKVPAKVVVKK